MVEGNVALFETRVEPAPGKLIARPTAREETAVVVEGLGLDDECAVEYGLLKVHARSQRNRRFDEPEVNFRS